MSGVLHRLADRALGIEAALRPTPSQVVGRGLALRAEGPDDQRPAPLRPQPEPRPGGEERRSPEPVPTPAQGVDGDGAARAAVPRAGSSPGEVGGERVPSTASGGPPATAPPPRPRLAAATERAEAGRAGSIADPRGAGNATGEPASPAPSRPGAADLRAGPPVRPAAPARTPAGRASTAPADRTRPSPAAPAPVTSPPPAWRPRGARAARPEAAEPTTITVSIGRVELRAGAPAAASARTGSAEPRLSLEAYLEGRAS